MHIDDRHHDYAFQTQGMLYMGHMINMSHLCIFIHIYA